MRKFSYIISQPIILLVLIVTGCTTAYKSTDFNILYGPSAVKERVLTVQQLEQQKGKVSYEQEIKPILESRCVACHACYDAPCQLKLSSSEGLDRGATKQLVYDFARMSPAHPMRLFIDATSTADWRENDFYPVLNERMDSATAALENSILAKLLELKRINPLPESGKLPESFDMDYSRELVCPAVDEFSEYKNDHPMWGMPYAMPGLSLKEEDILKKWLKEGAKVEPGKPLSISAVNEISKWEKYLNRPSLNEKLVARYIYEHLFIGHLHFKEHPDNEFYKLVRSKTASGQEIDEIASIRPYDDPGVVDFYYRLRPVISTIVDKTHFVYELSDQRMRRYDELFFQIEYKVSESPSYKPEFASNPFKTYIDIPNNSKYQFLLDEAEYFVSGFIKGPSCRGQMALNSIRDRFWVLFTKPNVEYQKEISLFLAEQRQTLSLPGTEADEIGIFGFNEYDKLGKKYLLKKEEFIHDTLPNNIGFDLSLIWDGNRLNQNAALTIFRHYDSATVTKGLVGDTPLTAWVVDYTILERLHYLLVAGFNVYGTAGHQLASRTYMDILRMDGENNFLRFMPASQRMAMHDSWYLGYTGLRPVVPLFNSDHETDLVYKTKNYKKEFFDQVRQKLGRAAGPIDIINECDQEQCSAENASFFEHEISRQMSKLAKLKGQELKAIPEVSFVRVKTGEPDGDRVFTLLVNKALSNVSMLLAENSRRIPENDTLTVVPGFIGSYPNFFFSVEINQLDEFINSIKNAQTEADMELLNRKFGIRRSNPKIWKYVDWFNSEHKKYRGRVAGLLNLNRYHNR